MSVAVLALLSDPVDSVEVFIGAQSRQWVLQWVHKFTRAVTVHTGCSAAAAILLIVSWEGGKGSERETREKGIRCTLTTSHTKHQSLACNHNGLLLRCQVPHFVLLFSAMLCWSSLILICLWLRCHLCFLWSEEVINE